MEEVQSKIVTIVIAWLGAMLSIGLSVMVYYDIRTPPIYYYENKEEFIITEDNSKNDFLRFSKSAPLQVTGVTIDFYPGEKGMRGGGIEGMLVYLTIKDYHAILSKHGSFDTAPQQSYTSRTKTLALIPNQAKVGQTRSLDLSKGTRFKLTGNYLRFRSGKLKGKSIPPPKGKHSYFLVERIKT